MDTAYTRAKTDQEREALAHAIAQLRLDGVPWDGPGGIVDSRRLVSSAGQGRALLRKYKLDAQSGGPVEILPSYDRHEINPATGRRKGYREPKRPKPGERDMTWEEAQAIRREADAEGPPRAAAKQAGKRARVQDSRAATERRRRYPTLDDGSTSVRAIPTPFETNRSRH
jgi:hypothetical protein